MYNNDFLMNFFVYYANYSFCKKEIRKIIDNLKKQAMKVKAFSHFSS